MHTCALLVILCCLSSIAIADESDDREALAVRHQAILDAHRRIGLDAWLSSTANDYVLANRGVISHAPREDRSRNFRDYIGSTTFEYYRDMVPPVIKVSQDGTLGWVIAQIEARGVRGSNHFEFQSAWIELYEKRNGQWIEIGNVSNFKE